jgi:hypothetical protein
VTLAARQRRQACWQAGHDAAARLDKAGHFASGDPTYDAYDEYLYLIGVSNYLTAKARDLAHIDGHLTGEVIALHGQS